MKKITLLLICVLAQILVCAQDSIPVTKTPVGVRKNIPGIEGAELGGQGQMAIASSSSEPTATTMIEANPAMVTAIASPNLYTGTLGIQIPIYTINAHGVSVPISLSYSGGGLKYTDISSWVGAGWNLSAGGQISRMKRDKLDEKDNDSDRDIFSFNLPGGLSGLFVFDQNWVVQTIPYQNVDITWNRTANTFTIKDLNGLTYELDIKETDVDKENNSTTVNWLLSKIKNYTGKVLMEFSYEYSAQMNYTRPSEGKFIRAKDGSSAPLSNLVKVETTLSEMETTEKNMRFLSQITWSGGKLTFGSEAYTNESGASRRLNSINLYAKDKSSVIKVIGLNYKKFPRSNRLQLFSISDATTSTPFMLFRFFYNNAYSSHPTSSKYADHWGYYRDGSYESFPSKIWSETGTRYSYPGSSTTERRDPNLAYAQTDALKMLEVVPSGARKIFEYELHDANNFSFPIGGLRIRSVTETDNLNSYNYKTKYEYKNSLGQSSGELYCSKPVNFFVSNMSGGWVIQLCSNLFNIHDITGNYIGYSQVKVINPNNSYTIAKFTNHSNYPDVQETIWSDIKAMNNPVTAFNKHVMWKTSNAYKRGLPTEIINYDASGMQVSKQTNSYVFGPEKGRVTSRQLIRMRCSAHPDGFLKYRYTYTVETDYHWVSVPVMLQSTTTEVKGQMPTTTTYTYDNTYYLPNQIVSTSGGTNQTTKILYPFDYNTSTVYTDPSNKITYCGSAINSMKQYKILNAPVEKIYFKNGQLVGAEISLYQKFHITPYTNIVPLARGVLNLQKNEYNPSFGSTISGGYFTCDSRYEFVENFDYYDSDLRPISSHGQNGPPKSVIYSSIMDFPIASVDKAYYYVGTERFNQVYHTSFEDDASTTTTYYAKSGSKVKSGTFNIPLSNFTAGNYILSYWKSTNNGSSWEQVTCPITVNSGVTGYSIGGSFWIDEVRVMPSDALMTTCTYSLQGYKTSETDINGRTTYWEYDTQGRVVRVLDNMRNPMKKYEYTINQ